MANLNGISFKQDDDHQKATIHADDPEVTFQGHVSDQPGKTSWLNWKENEREPFFMREVSVFLTLDDLKHLHETIGEMLEKHEPEPVSSM